MINFYNKKGFVSLASMGIVSVVGVIFIAFAPAFVVSNSSYNDLEYAASRGHDAQTISNLMGIQNELVEYYLINGEYPSKDSCLDLSTVSANSFGGRGLADDLRPYFKSFDRAGDNVSSYIFERDKKCPDRSYYYIVDPSGDGAYAFGLYAKLSQSDTMGAVSCSLLLLDKTRFEAPLDSEDSCYVVLSE